MRLPAFLLAAALLPACAGPATTGAVPVHYDIGAIHRDVTADAPGARLWFDRGLALCFGFNHEEAVACFERATELDPGCALAYWGKAYALGPNYNNPVVAPEAWAAAYEALQQAAACVDGCTAVERDLLAAMRARFPSAEVEPREPLEAAYAEAMRRVHRAHPEDPDVAALTAEAIMQLRPWKLWSPEGVPAPETAEIRAVLEPALARWPSHPALCHLYIHTMEAGPEVERAIPYARNLEGAAPGLGHLVHMPSHVYVWTGSYADVVRVNLAAVERDDAYVEHAGRENFYSLYRLHNYHFVAYGAMWEGRKALAVEYSRRLVDEVPPGLLAAVPDLLDVFLATPYHVMVRFGMWDELVDEPEPAPQHLAARAVWSYSRGVALASLGRVDEARREQQRFARYKAAVPETRLLFNNPVARILDVAENVLAGEIEYRAGDHDRAFELLRAAVALDEELNYDEPWGWMEPARHALGALLTEQGRYEEAESVYRRNLERYPENGWALNGLAECLEETGRPVEAAQARRRFEKAWARADVQIPGSCFCKTR